MSVKQKLQPDGARAGRWQQRYGIGCGDTATNSVAIYRHPLRIRPEINVREGRSSLHRTFVHQKRNPSFASSPAFAILHNKCMHLGFGCDQPRFVTMGIGGWPSTFARKHSVSFSSAIEAHENDPRRIIHRLQWGRSLQQIEFDRGHAERAKFFGGGNSDASPDIRRTASRRHGAIGKVTGLRVVVLKRIRTAHRGLCVGKGTEIDEISRHCSRVCGQSRLSFPNHLVSLGISCVLGGLPLRHSRRMPAD